MAVNFPDGASGILTPDSSAITASQAINYTSRDYILCNPTSANITLTLNDSLSSSYVANRVIMIENIGTYNVIVNADDATLIDTITPKSTKRFRSTQANPSTNTHFVVPRDANIPNINFIINGNFDVWQRGTSFATAASGQYTADRFRIAYVTAGVVSILRSTDVPAVSSTSSASNYSLHVDVTTADASVASTDVFFVAQHIEGLNYQNIHSKQVTLSFWVKGTKTGTYCVAFKNSANDRNYIAEYTINTTDTWEKKIITLTLDTSGTWLFTNGVGLKLYWCLMGGSNFQGSANTWQAGDLVCTSNQVNALDSTANDFRLSQVQLELGSQATPFKPHGGSFNSDLLACYRYCFAPASNNLYTNGNLVYRMTDYDANRMFFSVPLVVPLRAGSATLANTTETTYWIVQTTAGVAQTGFAIILGATQANNLYLTATKTTHGLTDGGFTIFASATPLLFSSEL